MGLIGRGNGKLDEGMGKDEAKGKCGQTKGCLLLSESWLSGMILLGTCERREGAMGARASLGRRTMKTVS